MIQSLHYTRIAKQTNIPFGVTTRFNVLLPTGNTNDLLMMDVDEPVSRGGHSFAARLGHAGLSPLVIADVSNARLTQEYLSRLLPPSQPQMQSLGRTGLGFDHCMLRHECVCGDTNLHPENPRRLQSIWSHLVATGLAEQCVKVSREATLEEIRSVHSETHTILYGASSSSNNSSSSINSSSSTNSSSNNTASNFSLLKCGGLGVDSDTYWNEHHTSLAARTAAGSVVELSSLVRNYNLNF
jgi:hypothetical protein